MNNNTPFVSIDPDENYFDAFDSSTLNICKYFSYKEYHDFFHDKDNNYFSIVNYNIRSFLANKETMFGIFDSLDSYPDILILTETWFTEVNIQNILGYKGFHTVRKNRRSGGVSVYVRNCISAEMKISSSFENENIEICTVGIILDGISWNLLCIYRPHSGTIENFINSLEYILNKPEIKNKNSIILGDINIDLLKECSSTESFINFMQSLYFIPKITKPTRFSPIAGISPSLLDHIWINSTNLNPSGILSSFTDHCITFIGISCLSRQKNHKYFIKIPFRPFSEFNLNRLTNYVTNFDWESIRSDNVNVCMSSFIEKIDYFYCKSFPIKIKQVTRKTYENPWVTKDILKLINYKSTFFNLNKKGIISDKENNAFKNKVQRIIRESKIKYFESSFYRSRNNIKKLGIL